MNIKIIMENWNKFLKEGKMPMGPGPDGKKGTDDDKPAFLNQKSDDDGGKKKKGKVPPQLAKHVKGKQDKKDEEEDPIEEADEGAFAPNHYCVHHGGVQHEGRIIEAEAIHHNYDFDLGKVTHYDMKLPDGTILEDVAAEDILITKASLAEVHGKRDHKKIKKLKEKKCPSCEKAPCEC
ncbi:MAG: hypothetical protein CBD16_03400 [Betaproteobacteria bacterium TMED156]|nr:MAG: hypothetical protein CBD16_03400 [Betaproteobacteria bacterium TMED156]